MKTHNFRIANLDTDSISFAKPDGAPFSDDEQTALLADLNSNFPEKIKWEHDGIYSRVCILKAKNYILLQDGKLSKKGSALKSSKIEPRLKDFMGELITVLMADRTEGLSLTTEILAVFHAYVREVYNLKNIAGWASKKTITDAVLNPERTTERKILDSMKGAVPQMGDKIYVYFGEEPGKKMVKRVKTDRATKIKTEYLVEVDCIVHPLHLRESWDAAAPNHSVDALLEKLYNTLVIFKNVIDIAAIPKYHNKSKQIKATLAEVLADKDSCPKT